MSRQLGVAAASIAAAAGAYVTLCAPKEDGVFENTTGSKLVKRISENAMTAAENLAEPFSADKGRPRSVLRQVDTVLEK